MREKKKRRKGGKEGKCKEKGAGKEEREREREKEEQAERRGKRGKQVFKEKRKYKSGELEKRTGAR